MQIFYFITNYLQIKVTYLYLHFLTDGYGKEINLPTVFIRISAQPRISAHLE